jgi:membrane associated rhomboid family serine protease
LGFGSVVIFFPLRDDNPVRTKPVVTYLLIAANVAAFLWQASLELAGARVTLEYGLVPARLLADPADQALTVLTSMFLHGGLMHLGSNLWFLHVFGDNIEDTLGRVRYLLFYLSCGIAAAAAQVLLDVDSGVPMVGASGAIAGVVGSYLVLYPRAPILSLNMVPLLWLFLGIFVVVPAWLIAGLFFLTNLTSAFLMLGSMQNAGVAFFAHLGGFVAGFLATLGFVDRSRVPRRVSPEWRRVRRNPRSWRRY